MDNEFPWIYVAMIVIAFISWILNRIQEFTSARKDARAHREPPQTPRQVREAQTPSREPWLPDEESPREPSRRPDPGDSLRELFEALGGAPATPPPPIRRPEKAAAAPPRQPVAIPKPPPIAIPKPPLKPPAVKKPQSQDAERARLLLKSRTGLRQAMILKEILDKPLGMRITERGIWKED